MKIRISALFLIFAFAISFSSCKKDDKVIPELAGSTYELYKIEATVPVLGVQTTEVAKDGQEYFKWKFVAGGKLEDGNSLEIGTWVQNGENVTVTMGSTTFECKVGGNDLTYEYNLIFDIKNFMRKI